ncbi:MAG: 3'-5' exonuclease domain-containing protein 2 [Burkholderiales bacterium]|nr:3'-5' exonuclease domain-containing protein 2 [Burkholderiales bacterium]MBP6676961.1 3'-5' exonuclease domain-containing protein 2 [Vitreoscilla sp.]
MGPSTALPHPSRDEILQMPPYERLPLARIHLVRSDEQAAAALRKIAEAGQVGFDTESRPLFKKDAPQEGPHVVQLATRHEAYIVQVNAQAPVAFLREVLGSAHITKVGFGLKSDRGPLLHKLGIQLAAAIELDQIVRRLGYRQAVGLKAAVAIVLGRRLQKSRKITTSNWALPTLSPAQLQYAADDAHASLAVYLAMGCPAAPAPIRAGSTGDQDGNRA